LLHPCSFALIPGYIAYLVESKSSTHGILSGLIFTAGLISVLAILGALISFVGGILVTVLPWLQLIVALSIIFLGLIQISGLTMDSIAPRFKVKRGFIGLYVFGLAFGLVISGCSAPVFFSIMLYSFISGIQNGILTLISYGLGMGIITMAVSVLTLRTKQTILKKINRYSNWINRITGIILIVAGLYILRNALSLI
jgi:cytochrome c-type biogenesis protein